MYAAFLEGLAELAKQLDEVAKLGGSGTTGVPTPYLAGEVEVRLDGELVGHFVFEDEYVVYRPTERV